VIRGDRGVGKTALLSYAVERSSESRVLSAIGARSESALAFAGLHQLVRPVMEHLDALPDVQATALQGALGLQQAPAADRFLAGLALLSLLSELSEEQPVLCVVDDAQWLDPESLDALLFVARRMDAEGIALLLATTDAGGGAADPELPQISMVGLDRGASDTLLVERSGVTPAPNVRAFLWKNTRGNPLALIEMSSALSERQLEGRDPLPDDLRLGVALQHTLLARANHLPEQTRTLLLVAAAEGTGDVGLVLRAGRALGAEAGALDPAEMAGIVRVDETGIVFRDPLMRTAIYEGAPFGDRLEAHRALAGHLSGGGDADRRVWHLAAATVGPDDGVADELERSAERARARGGYAAASVALERSADLASEPSTTGRRLTGAAADAWSAGRGDRTRVLLDRAAPLVSDARLRADADRLRGLVEAGSGDRRVAYEILRAGSDRIASLDPGRAAGMLVEAGRIAWSDADPAGMVEVGRRMQLLELDRDAPWVFAVHVMIGLGRLLQGDAPSATPLIASTVAGADPGDPGQLEIAGTASIFIGDDRTARRLLTRAVARARALGEVSRVPQVLAPLASLDMWAGEYARAAARAAEGAALARETGQDHLAAHFGAVLAWIAAVRGRAEECDELALDALGLGRAHGVRPPVAIASWALALSDLGAGRWPEAMARLSALVAPDSPESHPMVVLLATGDLVEAALRVGRPDLAQDALEGFERLAGRAAAWTLALVARCRALLADDKAAGRLFEESLARHAEGARPFDEARTHLLYGAFLRGARRRMDARPHLRRAIETFERLGAAPWEQRARAELRATGETARKRRASALDELTPRQVQLVQLVAEGATDKEMAAQLFLSPRTVDHHLRNAFAKLGVASRAELVRIPDLEETVRLPS
jgi:DNA-binding CsgD family transcriptional regulator